MGVWDWSFLVLELELFYNIRLALLVIFFLCALISWVVVCWVVAFCWVVEAVAKRKAECVCE